MSIVELKKELTIAKNIKLTIKIKPNADKDQLLGFLADNSLKIAIKAVPEDGKANTALIKFLADMFEVAKQNIVIASGKSSRLKIVKIKI